MKNEMPKAKKNKNIKCLPLNRKKVSLIIKKSIVNLKMLNYIVVG